MILANISLSHLLSRAGSISSLNTWSPPRLLAAPDMMIRVYNILWTTWYDIVNNRVFYLSDHPLLLPQKYETAESSLFNSLLIHCNWCTGIMLNPLKFRQVGKNHNKVHARKIIWMQSKWARVVSKSILANIFVDFIKAPVLNTKRLNI